MIKYPDVIRWSKNDINPRAIRLLNYAYLFILVNERTAEVGGGGVFNTKPEFEAGIIE